jgi:hypothetical protein
MPYATGCRNKHVQVTNEFEGTPLGMGQVQELKAH